MARDTAHWALPLNQFHHPVSVARRDFVRNQLFFPCMQQQGYDLGEMPPASFPFDGVTVNAAGRGLFNEALASQYGYGGPAQAAVPSTAEATLARLDTPEGAEAQQACAEEVGAAIPPAPSTSLLASLEAAAYTSAFESEPVRQAAARWRECMEGVGVADLPPDPGPMPSDSLRSRFEAAKLEDGTAGPDEIRVAEMDARCRESSDWAAMLYATEWDNQVGLLRDNEAGLERLRAANERHASLLEEALSGPGG